MNNVTTAANSVSPRKLFLNKTLLIFACIALNVVLSYFSQAVIPSEFSLYMDDVGTMIAVMLGGYLPGVIVGFASNIISSFFTSQLTMYFGTISVLFALAVRALFNKGMFNNFAKRILSALGLALMCASLGALLTWLLYGFDVGSEISAPLAKKILELTGNSPFLALFLSDLAINIVDKIIVVALAQLLFHYCPQRIKEALGADDPERQNSGGRFNIRGFFKSILGKLVFMMVLFAVAMCLLVTGVCYYMYRDTNIEKFTVTAEDTAALAAKSIDAESIDDYIALRGEYYSDYLDHKKNLIASLERSDASDGSVLERHPEIFDEFGEFVFANYTSGYVESFKRLMDIGDSTQGLEYLYIYKIEPDGCHVVFDIDYTAYYPLVDFDESFKDYIPDLLHGKEIEPIITDDTYGWLLTVYSPIYDSNGICQAYACADISMDTLRVDQTIFITKVIDLIIGAALILVVLLINRAKKYIVTPLNDITEAATEYAFDTSADHEIKNEKLNSLNIHSGDEVEALYNSLRKLANDATQHINKIKSDADTIAALQEGIIVDFANMVESRDQNTGDHIKKTSYYVKRIAEELKKEGVYTETLTDEYIAKIVRSAPLHDIGKIKVSDILLNKPGKLTEEEFEIMKTHTTAGRDILDNSMVHAVNSDYFEEAINMASYHHEWWNGRGYPARLKGEEIPLSARIMAVADVYDALISKRSYKGPFPVNEAVDIIREESGTHFDPKIVDAFLNICDEL